MFIGTAYLGRYSEKLHPKQSQSPLGPRNIEMASAQNLEVT
jgi:hypothetical protein